MSHDTSGAAPKLPGLGPTLQDQGRISGTVLKILHADLATGRTVARIRTQSGEAVVAGRGDPVGVGDEIEADGAWTHHPRFGRQFAADRIRGSVPVTGRGVARYLEGAGIPGVGRGTLDRLVRSFGDGLPDALDSPESLASAGLPEQKARAISRHWRLRTRHARLLSLLHAHGMGPATAERIVSKYGDATMRTLQADPYRLASDIRGIGFGTADRIALSQGVSRDAPERVRAGIRRQMQLIHQSGSCAAPRDVLRRDAARLLEVRERVADEHVDALMAEGELVEETIGERPVLYERGMRDAEAELADRIASLSDRVCELRAIHPDPDGLIGSCARAWGFRLNDEQHAAVRTALEHGVSVITGGPGSGKTATLLTLVEAARELFGETDRVLLAAPTGRAAKRMQESTGVAACTVHRLLEWSSEPGVRGFRRGVDNPLDADAVACDEFSMMDVHLARDTLRATAPGTRIVMVGDDDQLESVGPGAVLADVVASGAVPVTRLTEIYRQAEGSGIAAAAREINAGRVPRMTTPRHSSDMWRVWTETAEEAAARIVKLCAEVLPGLGWDPLRDVQVLTPGHNSPAGTRELNARLQETLNPGGAGVPEIARSNGTTFRTGDRVIQVSNDHEKEIYNGDVGRVVEIRDGTAGGRGLDVDFDGQRVTYAAGDLDQIQHAFATTIHKFQGSEVPVVVCAMTTQHYIMLRRNLVYTALTRARSLCCVIGQERAFRIAVKRRGDRRLTGLAQRLAGKRMVPGATDPDPTNADPTDTDTTDTEGAF